MDLRRLHAGEWIVGLSGAALILSLFLPWYRFEPSGAMLAYGPATDTGWEAFALLDIGLLIAGLLALALPVVTATQKTVAVPTALGSLTALVGALAFALVVLRAFIEPAPPGTEGLHASVDVTKGAGLWVGLAGAAGIAAGAWHAIRDERLSKPGRPSDATGRAVPHPRPIEALPPPEP